VHYYNVQKGKSYERRGPRYFRNNQPGMVETVAARGIGAEVDVQPWRDGSEQEVLGERLSTLTPALYK
jgi:hypothetical protein